MRIGLDTSVLLRLLLGEPSEQAATALAFVRESWLAGRRIVVSDLVAATPPFVRRLAFGIGQHGLKELRQTLPMGGGNRDRLTKPEPIGLGAPRLGDPAFAFVGDQQDRSFRLS